MATASALYSAQEITDSPSNNLIMAEPQIANYARIILRPKAKQKVGMGYRPLGGAISPSIDK